MLPTDTSSSVVHGAKDDLVPGAKRQAASQEVEALRRVMRNRNFLRRAAKDLSRRFPGLLESLVPGPTPDVEPGIRFTLFKVLLSRLLHRYAGSCR